MTKNGVTFDLGTLQIVPWQVMLDDVRYVEQLGIGTFWLGDHYAWVPTPAESVLEAWTTLAALAAATSRIRLGTLITNVATRHPAMLAKQAATVDCISNGRLELGLGAGYFERELEWLGIPWLTPAGRADRLREAVRLIDQLLREGHATHYGTYYQVDNAPFHPRPIQQPRPPLTLAADGKKSLRLTAEYADVWVSGPGDGTREEGLQTWREHSLLLDEYCDAISRDPKTLVRGLLIWGTAETPFASLAAFQDFVGRYREAGVQRFMIGFASAGPWKVDADAGRLASRKTLDVFAAQAMADLCAEG